MWYLSAMRHFVPNGCTFTWFGFPSLQSEHKTLHRYPAAVPYDSRRPVTALRNSFAGPTPSTPSTPSTRSSPTPHWPEFRQANSLWDPEDFVGEAQTPSPSDRTHSNFSHRDVGYRNFGNHFSATNCFTSIDLRPKNIMANSQ